MIPDNKITDAVLNHIWGITCAVATVTGIPFFYDLLAKTDLNTDAARTIITLAGVIISGVSFALGWNQRNISAGRESAALRIENTSIRSEVERLQSTIDGKDKALETQKEKNAELAARLRDLTLDGNRKRRIFNTLNEREKWLLAAILDMSPMVPSSNDNRIIPCLKFMCDAGILLDTGIVTVNGAEKESFTIKSDWRTWLADHADELPNPHSDMPE